MGFEFLRKPDRLARLDEIAFPESPAPRGVAQEKGGCLHAGVGRRAEALDPGPKALSLIEWSLAPTVLEAKLLPEGLLFDRACVHQPGGSGPGLCRGLVLIEDSGEVEDARGALGEEFDVGFGKLDKIDGIRVHGVALPGKKRYIREWDTRCPAAEILFGFINFPKVRAFSVSLRPTSRGIQAGRSPRSWRRSAGRGPGARSNRGRGASSRGRGSSRALPYRSTSVRGASAVRALLWLRLRRIGAWRGLWGLL